MMLSTFVLHSTPTCCGLASLEACLCHCLHCTGPLLLHCPPAASLTSQLCATSSNVLQSLGNVPLHGSTTPRWSTSGEGVVVGVVVGVDYSVVDSMSPLFYEGSV